MSIDLVIRSRRVITPDGIAPAAVHISGGRIVSVAEWNSPSPGADLVDAGDAVVMPGLVDAHVHVNEPGRTDWEGYTTATRAAAAGGVTAIVDMPLNSIPPTTTQAGFAEKLAAAEGQCWVDVAFWGGVVPGNTNQLAVLLDDGVRGFKCFLIHSGVDEFPHVEENDLLKAMPELARIGSVLLVHAELPGPIDRAAAALAGADPRAYDTFLRSRPRESENEAIAQMVRLCRATGARVHIVHHSSSDALAIVAAAKDEGLPLTVETCPHYLTFAAEDIPPGATHYKCCPPVRERENREKLWQALADGTIDMVVSDHSPCTPDLKLRERGDFMEAWGGISTLQFGLPVLWTGARARGFGLEDISRWMSAATAKLAGLDSRKGHLKPGYDADITIWRPDREFTVETAAIRFKNKVTPYDGMELFGVVEATYVRGEKVFGKEGFSGKSLGIFLLDKTRGA